MPRPTSFTPDILAERALQQFWSHGFFASSMDDLVKATGVSRHGIYATFGGKKELFLACFDCYQHSVVTPAFQVVEEADADLTSIAIYFERQITLGETVGLPGPGCFVANSATEVAPTDVEVMQQVKHHNDRLKRGFASALKTSMPSVKTDRAANLAEVMLIFTNGLWTQSRSVDNAEILRRAVKNFLSLLANRYQ